MITEAKAKQLLDRMLERARKAGAEAAATVWASRGGNTLFANMYAAYDALPEDLKRRLEGRRALNVYDYDNSPTLRAAVREDAPRFVHPVVRTHPETGRKALYINIGHTARFEGWTEEESAPLLNFLHQHQIKAEFTCRFQWRVGSLALWDNRAALHYPINDYHGHRRIMHRITLKGDRPR